MKIKKKKNSINLLNITNTTPYKEKPNEKYMNDTQIKHFKKILFNLHKKLTFNIKNKKILKNKENKNFPDLIDRAAQEEEFKFTLRNIDRERKIINKIENTIKKIKEKNFGYCDTCNIKIGIKRLEAQPTAELCIDCKILSEIKEKQINT